MKNNLCWWVATNFLLLQVVRAFVVPFSSVNNIREHVVSSEDVVALQAQKTDDWSDLTTRSRRTFFKDTRQILGVSFTSAVLCGSALNAHALVKGVPPPPKKGVSEERKCRNVEECQERAERLSSQQEEDLKNQSTPPKTTSLGTRYRDLEPESLESSLPSTVAAKSGDTVSIRYKILKLGKRSYDGLTGEGTVIFSRGYGLEDDEKNPGETSFTFQLGDPTVIVALNDAVSGMTVGSTRRISILPQYGWRIPGRVCDGGPGGSGTGGELKTDYVVIPTATMVAEETCFDTTKRPFPTTFAQQRRMAQRFDQSLIAEVQLVNVA